jgi:MFS family permease
VFGAYSWSLLVAGLAATPIGMLLDRFGGRLIMGFGSVVCSAGLAALSTSRSPAAYVIAWTILGFAMGLTLYEAAFATINRRFALQGRSAISTLTLFAGFASTIFWPVTQALHTSIGWRNTYFLYGVIQLIVCLPLHLLLGPDGPRAGAPADSEHRSHTLIEAIRHPAFWKLALAFSANVSVFSALSVHLIPLLQRLGHAPALAVLLAMVIGPMQVIGRVLERTAGRKAAPQTVGKYCFTALPAAVVIALLFGVEAWAVAAFCVLYGLGNGVITIVRGTLPQAIFGSEHYGAIAGAMAGPALIAKAAGPLVIAAALNCYADPLVSLAVLLCFALTFVLLYWCAVTSPVI